MYRLQGFRELLKFSKGFYPELPGGQSKEGKRQSQHHSIYLEMQPGWQFSGCCQQWPVTSSGSTACFHKVPPHPPRCPEHLFAWEGLQGASSEPSLSLGARRLGCTRVILLFLVQCVATQSPWDSLHSCPSACV